MSEAEKQAVRDVWVRFVELYKNKQFQAVADLYTDDCKALPPGGQIIEGKEALKEAYAEISANGLARWRIETQEVVICGDDHAVHRGNLTSYDKDGNVIDDGKDMELVRKVDGEWKIYLDVWNSNKA